MEDFSPVATARTVQIDISGDNLLHYAALPDGKSSIDPVPFPEEPILEYSFPLDEFQKCAIGCVHNNNSVLVSAHTSAGKTAIAYYAIALALKNQSRVIYTSPIKALSNQKYEELLDKFGDVGLMTGDITISPNASCLVMTTEILRMMLFNGTGFIREVSWVIYDEVHYMKDPSRGVVWEESIILLPDQIRFVFLSATIPNAREFSEWIAQIHHQPCHVVYTEHRPVPLRYYISPISETKPILVRTADGEMDDHALSVACSSSFLSSSSSSSSSSGSSRFSGISVHSGIESSSALPKISKKVQAAHTCEIVNQIHNMNLSPTIIFVFSRHECNKLPDGLRGRNFIKDEQRALVDKIFEAATAKLDEEDRNLPQVTRTLELARRGIGVHHGGLLPLMKEVVEILLQHSLIVILFATETFAMGLNMPAKTVLFHMLHKFDGNERRLLAPGEFIQMSGRAGRRNKDKFGAVVVNYTGEVPQQDLKNLMISSAQPLNSEFRVTYNMLLNLLPASGFTPKDIMQRSFHQFQMIKALPDLIKRRDEAQNNADKIILSNFELAEKIVEIQSTLANCEEEMRNIAFSEANCKNLITPGKILKLKNWGWTLVVSFNPNSDSKLSEKSEFIVLAGGIENFERKIIPAIPGKPCAPYLIREKFKAIEG